MTGTPGMPIDRTIEGFNRITSSYSPLVSVNRLLLGAKRSFVKADETITNIFTVVATTMS